VLSALGPNRVVRGESPHNLCKLKMGTKHKTNATFFAGAVYWCICAFGWCFTCTDTAPISLLLRPKERCQQVLSSHSLDYTCSMDRSAAPLTHAQYLRCLRRIMSWAHFILHAAQPLGDRWPFRRTTSQAARFDCISKGLLRRLGRTSWGDALGKVV